MENGTFKLLKTLNEITEGKTDSFREIVREYEKMVFGFLSNQIYCRCDAEDLTQATFLSAFEKIHTYSYEEGVNDFGAWLRGIARNKAKMYFRSMSRRDSALERYQLEVTEILECEAGDTTKELNDIRVSSLSEHIKRLPEKMKIVVEGILAGKKTEELALRINSSPANVYVTYYRSHKLLRKWMTQKTV